MAGVLDLLWLVPALPAAGFVVLVFLGTRLSRPAAAAVGVGSVGAAALLALGIAIRFIASPPGGHAFTQVLWTWLSVAGLAPRFALLLDPLSLVMVGVVTGVGFLIHLYSAEYMGDDPGLPRFFAYMNLFVAAMLLLVLADNLVFLYLGWEGVGLCSYLLIGFWYQDPANGRAGRKAFVVTRVGDAAFALGLFLLFAHLGTLQIQDLLARAQAVWPVGSPLAVAAAALLLCGACGKSAQLPLQTWLPDAMAGPTPVSALIHAATMVTAGVYLIARTHALFALAPAVQFAVAAIGAATLVLAGLAALAQRDIKRVLAYSTISQIGLMFLALGVGAWSAAIFHFLTHAFFKALLFLAAGAVILALHHEQDIFRMGGLRRELPGVYRAFLVGAAALAGFPLVTAGFYSKGWILVEAWNGPHAGPVLFAAGAFGALCTAVYIFRLVFLVFFGEARTPVHRAPGWKLRVPLMVLAVLSVVGGFVEIPSWLGDRPTFSNFLAPVLPRVATAHAGGLDLVLEAVAATLPLLGIWAAYVLFVKRWERTAATFSTGIGDSLRRLSLSGFGFDWLYERLFVRPFMFLARANRADAIDALFAAVAALVTACHQIVREMQTGLVRWYAAVLGLGAVLLLALAVWP